MRRKHVSIKACLLMLTSTLILRTPGAAPSIGLISVRPSALAFTEVDVDERAVVLHLYEIPDVGEGDQRGVLA